MGRIMTQGKHILGLFLETGNAVNFKGDSGSHTGSPASSLDPAAKIRRWGLIPNPTQRGC